VLSSAEALPLVDLTTGETAARQARRRRAVKEVVAVGREI